MPEIGIFSDELYAEMSDFAYVDVGSIDGSDDISYDNPVPVTELGGPESLEGWSVAAVIDDNNNSGVYALVLEDGDGNAVIAFRGSERLANEDFSLNDYLTDWYRGDLCLINNEETVYQEALVGFITDPEFIENIKKYDHIDLTGHSLGGHSAIVSFNEIFHLEDEELHSKLGDCISLDGPGGSDEFIAANPGLADCEGRIMQYSWSLVGNIFNKLPGVTYVNVKVIDEQQGKLFSSHSLSNLVFDEAGSVVEYTGEQTAIDFVNALVEKLDEKSRLYTWIALLHMNDIFKSVVLARQIGRHVPDNWYLKLQYWTTVVLVIAVTDVQNAITLIILLYPSIMELLGEELGKWLWQKVQEQLLEWKVYTEEQLDLIFNTVEKYLYEAIPLEQIICHFLTVSTEIIVDTVKAEVYRERLQRIKSQISSLSGQLGGISSHYGLLDLGGLLNGAFLTRHLWKIDANIAYLNTVIDSFESAENKLKVMTT